MKKLLAALAILGFATSAMADWDKGADKGRDLGKDIAGSHNKLNYPWKTLAGFVTSPTGNIVYYTVEAADIVKQDLVDQFVQKTIATGACLDKAEDRHIGVATGCAVEYAGDTVIYIWNVAGYEVTNLVDASNAIIDGLLSDVVGTPFRDMCAASKEKGMPVAAGTTCAMKFVVDVTAAISKITLNRVSVTGRDFTDTVALAAKSLVATPVFLLDPSKANLKNAADSAVLTIGFAGCSLIDVVLSPVRLGADYLNGIDKGARKIGTCKADMLLTAEQLKNGTYPTPAQDPNADLYRP